jgi:SAM-dependent methyltransferase
MNINIATRDWALEKLAQVKRAEPWHDMRYAMSLGYMVANLPVPPRRILDVGGPSPMVPLLAEMWGVEVSSTPDADLRDWSPAADEYDLVTCCEVLEHIHDLPTTDPDKRACWTGSGQKKLLEDCCRALKPGGHLFLTTPNATSLRVLQNVARDEHPRMYDPHVRELRVCEVERLVPQGGLKIVECRAWSVWDDLGVRDHMNQVLQAVRLLGGDPAGRNDDIILFARKL